MALTDIAAAMARVNAVLRKRPLAGIVDDAPATSAWQGGLRVLTQHPGGAQALTDMPAELGGSGDLPSPGWLLRASMASCAATRIAMAAAEAGVALHTLEVSAHSRSDARGLLGVPATDGTALFVGPCEMRLQVRIGAADVQAERLHALVEQAIALAPVSQVLARSSAVALQVEISPAAVAPAPA
jgi:uncharacterized OsmC-like protein